MNRSGSLIFIFATLVVSGCSLTGQQPFMADGCSMAPDCDFRDCCNTHDEAYWCGGTREQRRLADQVLRQCIIDKGHSWLGPLYYRGVRMFGGPGWPTTYRWGFGQDYPDGYTDSPRTCP